MCWQLDGLKLFRAVTPLPRDLCPYTDPTCYSWAGLVHADMTASHTGLYAHDVAAQRPAGRTLPSSSFSHACSLLRPLTNVSSQHSHCHLLGMGGLHIPPPAFTFLFIPHTLASSLQLTSFHYMCVSFMGMPSTQHSCPLLSMTHILPFHWATTRFLILKNMNGIPLCRMTAAHVCQRPLLSTIHYSAGSCLPPILPASYLLLPSIIGRLWDRLYHIMGGSPHLHLPSHYLS